MSQFLIKFASLFGIIFETYSTLITWLTLKTWIKVYVCIQLFRERLWGKVHVTILKDIVGGFEFSFFKEIWKNWQEKPWKCVCELKESNKSRFDSYSRQEHCIDHIPYYLSGLSRAHFFPTTFLKIAIYVWIVPHWQSNVMTSSSNCFDLRSFETGKFAYRRQSFKL